MASGNIKGITIEIGGDTRGLQDSLKDVNNESKKIQNELKDVEKALKLDPSNVDLVNQKMDLLADAVNASTTKLDALRAAQAQVEAQFQRGDIGEEQYRAFQRELSNTEASLRSYQTQMQSLQGDQDRLGRNQRDLQTYLNATGQSVNNLSNVLGTRLTNAIRDGSATSDQLEMALNRIGRQAGHSGQDLEEFRRILRTADNGSSLPQINLDLMQIGNTVEEVERNLDGFTDGLKDATLGVSAALTGLGAGAGIAASQFDNAVGQIQAALGVTAEEAESLEERAKNVWKAGFGESLEEVSNALVRVKQNIKGISDETELEQITKDALALAKTFDSDVVEVTRAANNLMTNFGLTSEEAFDKMAKGAQNGLNFSNEMFDNLAEYAPLFADAGYSADEMFTLLEKGAQKGIYNLDYLNDVVKEFGIRLVDGSDGTTDAIAQLFAPDDIDVFVSKLMESGKKTEQYGELVKKVGNETASEMVKNLQKGGKSAEDTTMAIMATMGDYNKVMNGISDGSITTSDAMEMIIGKLNEIEDPIQRNTLGVQMFGTKWEDLGADVVLSLGGVKGALNDTEGAMKSVTDAQEQTFGQRWESFTRSAAVSLEPLGKVLLDLAERWLPKIVAVVETLANWFANLSPVLQIASIAFGAIVAAIGPLIAIIGMLAPIITNVVTLFGGWGAIASAFGVVMTALSGPIGIVIGVIAGLIAIGVALYKNWDEISAFLISCWENIESVSSTIFGAISEFLSSIWNSIIVTVETIWTGISNFFKRIWDGISSIFKTVLKSILTVVEGYWKSMKDGITTVWDGITSIFKGVWEVIKNIFAGALLVILDLLTGNWGDAKSHTEQIWKNIQNALKSIWEGIKKVFSGTLDAIIGYVKTSWDNIKNSTTSVFNSVRSTISSIWENIKSTVSNTVSSIVSTVTNKFADIVNSVRNKMDETQSTIRNIWGSIMSFFSSINLFDIGKNIIQGLINGIGSLAREVTDKVREITDGIKNSITKALKINSPSKLTTQYGEWVGEGLVIGMDDMIQKVSQSSSRLANAVASAQGSLASSSAKSQQARMVNSTVSSSTIDNSKYMQPSITIINQVPNASPSEIARKSLQAQRQLAMEWGV